MQGTQVLTAFSPRQALDGQRVLRIPAKNTRNHPKVGNQLNNRSLLRKGTWNVESMYESGKIHNFIQEINRLKIDVLGINEMRWPASGRRKVDNKVLYYSGNDDARHGNGVGIMVSKQVEFVVLCFVPHSDRLLLMSLQGRPMNINIIVVYAPTVDKPEREIEIFYNQLSGPLQSTKKEEITILMGDFNAKVDNGRVEDVCGEYSLGVRNDRGDRLIQFCQEEDMIITNTWFKL